MGNLINPDTLVGLNLPRATFALSGGEWAETGEGAPIIINTHSPGIFEEDWGETYGAAYDAFLSIVDGGAVQASIDGSQFGGVYSAYPQTSSDNLWSPAGGVQQVSYLVSGGTIEEGREKTDTFGAVSEARGIGIRLPVMAVGYGKTIEMLPLEGTSRINPDSVKYDRAKWKTGSLDARWDDRRKTWATFNDLIVDHEEKGLGTVVFSSNPDGAEGFPYLKGRLQDVWWVRQPVDLDDSVGKQDGTQTARIMTHLEHEWFDEDEDGAAPLSSIFIIPHNSLDPVGTPDVCHEKGEENVLGSEVTGEAETIGIRTEAHFWQDKDADGAIAFGRKSSELGSLLSCDAVGAKFFWGEMVFLDNAVERCGSSVADLEPEKPCEWVPAVRIDECCLVGGHFSKFYGNDVNLASRISDVCAAVHIWSKILVTTINDNDAKIVTDGIACVVAELKKVTTALFNIIAASNISIIQTMQRLEDRTIDNFNKLVEQINAALAACGCESQVDVFFSDTHDISIAVPKPPVVKNCPVLISPADPFSCENCGPTELDAPCATNETEGPFKAPSIDPCGGNSSFKKADYEGAGECQTTSSAPPISVLD